MLNRLQPAWKRDLVAYLALLVFAGVIFARALCGRAVVYSYDLASLYHPWLSFLTEERRAGNWLPWCPYIGCGYPVWADIQSGAFYPANLLCMLPVSLGWMLGFVMACHYALGAVGMYTLCRGLGVRRLAAVVAGLLFVFTGFMLGHVEHYPCVCAAAWLPWAGLGALRWVGERRWWGFGLVAIGAAVPWTTHPQMSLYMVAFAAICALLGVMLSAGDGPTWRRLPAALGLLALPVGAGMLLAGVSLVPLWALLRAGLGRDTSYRFATDYSFHPAHLIAFLIPDFFGTRSYYWGHGDFAELCGYMGALPLCLIALVRPARNRRRVHCVLTGALVVALVLMLGKFTPLYRVLFHVPIFSAFRCPARWLLVLNAVLALLCALALDELRSRLGRGRFGRASLILAGLALLSALLAAEILLAPGLNRAVMRSGLQGLHVAQSDMARKDLYLRLPDEYPGMVGRNIGGGLWWLAAYLGAAAIGIHLCSKGVLRPEAAVWLIAGLILLEVGRFAWLHMDMAPPDALRPTAEAQRILGLGGNSGRWMWTSIPLKNRLPIALQPDANITSHREFVHIYDPVEPPVEWLLSRLGDRMVAPQVAASFGVKYALADQPLEVVSRRWRLLGRVPLGRGTEEVSVYQNDAYLGLAWTVGSLTPAEEGQARIRDPAKSAGFLLDAPWVEGVQSGPAGAAPGARQQGVEVVEWTPRTVRVRVGPGTASVLVIALPRLPGWQATMNGKPVSTRVANGVFTALSPVEPGEVVLTYHPGGFKAGLLVSLAGLVFSAACVVVLRPRRKRSGET